MTRVAIIGAGMTGLTAAHHLKQHTEVRLFEKSRGLGGRMATRRTDNASFDHGTQYFVAKSPEFNAFLREPLYAGAIALWRARFQEIDGQTGDTLSERPWDEAFPHYVGTPGMNSLAKYLARDMAIQRSTRVAQLERVNDRYWNLHSDQGEHLGQFDWVVLSCPPEQTATLLPSSCGFKSALPNIELLPCFSVMLAFSEPVALNFDAALIRHADISWVAQNNSKPERGTTQSIIIQSSNEWANRHLEKDINGIKQHLIREAERILNTDLSRATHSDIHRWRYANTVIQREHKGDVFIDTTLKLGAAGDWCGNARVESAYLHGKQLADAVTNAL
ncbi:hypothetical protein GCM10008090_29230 [Arenicella chitinivorans]|uniref:Amine oxidase domain-containing protein n=1 Tax=Arenicella chitinivorans TaxID=1329800 RepID=A0A918VRU4_9GAMM|nr:FAD-dependent oxidoreductase [Arenicella chitinivorans]GHA17679.1 hypothetical protein GCM10008090_29230 [Arenicella chitinivorans]